MSNSPNKSYVNNLIIDQSTKSQHITLNIKWNSSEIIITPQFPMQTIPNVDEYAYNVSTEKAQAEGLEIQNQLGYIVSSREV